MTTYVPRTKIDAIEFGVCGSSDNLEAAVITISSSKSLGSDDIKSPKLGTVEINKLCATCGYRNDFCIGHFAALTLKYPLQNPLFDITIKDWLDKICHKCGRLRNIKSDKDVFDKTQFCTNCNYTNPSIHRDKNTPVKIMATSFNEEKGMMVTRYLYNHEIYVIFDRIPDCDVIALGYPVKNHPRKLILKSIPVPPNNVRPLDSKLLKGKALISDITSVLTRIHDADSNLPIIDNKTPLPLKAEHENLCISMDIMYHQLILSSSAGSSHAIIGNKPIESIGLKAKGKRGFWRGFVHGKRAWWYARGVISGNPELRETEVKIPLEMAKHLIIPTIVTNFNIKELRICYINGSTTYPGASKIQLKGSHTPFGIDIFKRDNTKYLPQLGDILYIPLREGDTILINRNPSLLPTAMTAFTALITNDDTIQLSDSVCDLFNADFDGDNMNLYCVCLPHDIMELKEQYGTHTRFISEKNGVPQLGLQQDAIIALSQLSLSTVQISREVASILMPIKLPVIKDYYSGKELISYIIPRGINLRKKAKIYNKSIENYIYLPKSYVDIEIVDGNLISGVIDKSIVGIGARDGLFDLIYHEYNTGEVIDTIYKLKYLGIRWLKLEGFSIGIEDFMLNDKAKKEIELERQSIVESANQITNNFLSNNIITPLNITTYEYYEKLMIERLNILTDSMIRAILCGFKSYIDNPFIWMTNISGKGSIKNTCNIMACIGQILINGLRMAPTFGGDRTDVVFRRYDLSPEAYGFCHNSFMEGLKYENILFCAADARDAMMKRQISTATAGEGSRTAGKNNESLHTNNTFQTVRGKNNLVIQNLYGGYGFNMAKMSRFNLHNFNLSDTAFEELHSSDIDMFDHKFRNDDVIKMLADEYKVLLNDRNTIRSIKIETESRYEKEAYFNTSVMIPFNISKIINDVQIRTKDEIKDINSFNPSIMIEKVTSFIDRYTYVFSNKIMYNKYITAKKEGKNTKPFEISHKFKKALEVSIITIRYVLCTRQLLYNKISTNALDVVFENIFNNTRRVLIEAGSLVGILAAQSYSEPSTQYILNATHAVGGNKTDRIDRQKELAAAKDTNEMANSSMMLYVTEKYEDNRDEVYRIARSIEMLQFRSITHQSGYAILFEPGRKIAYGYDDDTKWIADFDRRHPQLVMQSNLLPYVLRFEINSEEMIYNFVSMEDIILSLYRKFKNNIHIKFSSELKNIIYMRIYIENIVLPKISESDLIKLYDSILDCKIRGIDGIKLASVSSVIRHYEGSDGSMKNRTIYGISTVGSNLAEIIKLPYFDTTKCQSDSPLEMLQCYGLDVAIQKLNDEFKEAQPDISPAHYTIFVDEMVSTGQITQLSSSGISKRLKDDVMLQVAYRNPMKILQEAALAGTVNYITSPTAALAIGQCMNIGTTYNAVTIVNED